MDHMAVLLTSPSEQAVTLTRHYRYNTRREIDAPAPARRERPAFVAQGQEDVRGCGVGDSQRHRHVVKGRNKRGERERKRRLDEFVSGDEAVCYMNLAAERPSVAHSNLRPPSGPASETTHWSGGNRKDVSEACALSRDKQKNGKAAERDCFIARARTEPKLKKKVGKLGANQASAKKMRMRGCKTRLNACDVILQDGKPDGPCHMAALVQTKDAPKGRGEGDVNATFEPRLKFSRDKGKLADMVPLYGTDRSATGTHSNSLCNDAAIDLYAILKDGSEREQVKFWASMRAERAWKSREKRQYADLDATEATSVAQHLAFLIAQGKRPKKEVAVELVRELGQGLGSADKLALSKHLLKSHVGDLLVEQEVDSAHNNQVVQVCPIEYGRSGGERLRDPNVKKRALQRQFEKIIHGCKLLPHREENAPGPSGAAVHQPPQGEHGSARAGKKSKTSQQQSSGALTTSDGAAMHQERGHGVQSALGMQLQPSGFDLNHYLLAQCANWHNIAHAMTYAATNTNMWQPQQTWNPPSGGVQRADVETGEPAWAAGAREDQGQETCGQGACARAYAPATVRDGDGAIGQRDKETVAPEGASAGAAASGACGSDADNRASNRPRGQEDDDEEERGDGSSWRQKQGWQAAAVSRSHSPAVCAARDLSLLHEKAGDAEEDQSAGQDARVAAVLLCDEVEEVKTGAASGGAGGVHGADEGKAAAPPEAALVASLPQADADAGGRQQASAGTVSLQHSRPLYAQGAAMGGGGPGVPGLVDLGAAAVRSPARHGPRDPELEAGQASTTTCLKAATHGADGAGAAGALNSESAASHSCPRGLPWTPCRAASPVHVSAGTLPPVAIVSHTSSGWGR